MFFQSQSILVILFFQLWLHAIIIKIIKICFSSSNLSFTNKAFRLHIRRVRVKLFKFYQKGSNIESRIITGYDLLFIRLKYSYHDLFSYLKDSSGLIHYAFYKLCAKSSFMIKFKISSKIFHSLISTTSYFFGSLALHLLFRPALHKTTIGNELCIMC